MGEGDGGIKVAVEETRDEEKENRKLVKDDRGLGGIGGSEIVSRL